MIELLMVLTWADVHTILHWKRTALSEDRLSCQRDIAVMRCLGKRTRADCVPYCGDWSGQVVERICGLGVSTHI